MVTMTSADKALKTLYLGAVAEQLNTEVNPLLTAIKQTTTDVWGKEVRRLVKYGVNGGVGAGDEDGDLPSASGNNYEQIVSTLKNLYGTIEISDKAIRASERDVGAFVNLLNAEMEGLVKASSFNFGRMLYGDGSGKLATVVNVNGNRVFCNTTKNIFEGMLIDFKTSSYEDTGVNGKRVTSIDRKTNCVFVDGTAINSAEVSPGSIVTLQGSANKEITGLGAIFGNSETLYGLNRENHKWLKPYIHESVGEISETDNSLVQNCNDCLKR